MAGGGTCWLHWGHKDGQTCKTECKINLPYTAYGNTLSDAECQLRVKRWLLSGLDWDPDLPNDRYMHIHGTRSRTLVSAIPGEDAEDPTPFIREDLLRQRLLFSFFHVIFMAQHVLCIHAFLSALRFAPCSLHSHALCTIMMQSTGVS